MREIDSLTLKSAKKGDHHAFKIIYDTYAPFLWKLLFPLSEQNIVLAKEFLQDTFIKAYYALQNFEENSTLSTWLYRLAYTTAMLHFNFRKRYQAQQIDESFESGDRSDAFDSRELVKKVMSKISPDDRFILIAREVHDFSFDELAIITGQTSGALRTKLHRIKTALRQHFPHECELTSEGR